MKIFMCGVGGQGLLLASRVLASAALSKDINVIMSAVHGMAQRGGTVTSSVIIGDGWSPLIGKGKADVILGFEPLEAIRACEMASEETMVLLNINKVIPFGVSIGKETYPNIRSIISDFRKITKKVYAIDGDKLAKKTGAAPTLNIVFLGALQKTGILPFDMGVMKKAIETTLKGRLVKVNLKAFELGYDAI